MSLLLLRLSRGPDATTRLAEPIIGTTGVVVIAMVIGGVALAGITASLIRSLGSRAIDRVPPGDIPRVLGILGTWIRLFGGFQTGRAEGPATCAQHLGPPLQAALAASGEDDEVEGSDDA